MAEKDPNGIYQYKPNEPICIAFALLFGTSTIYHVFQMFQKRTFFYVPLVVGAIMMTLGYVCRYFSAKDPSAMMPYVGQSLLIILPPSLYAASIYMIYGRIAAFVRTPRASIIRPTRITKIFVIGDVFAFFLQAGAGGMMAQESMADLGQKMMLVGLFVQLAFFGFFLLVAIIFRVRMRSTTAKYTLSAYGKHTWDQLIIILFVAAAVIILRCVYRIIEFGQGHGGYLASHEVFLYLFDAFPMFAVQALFHIIHAGDVFPPNFAMGKLDNESGTDLSLQPR